MPIYLDHAAATPVDKRVMAAMQPFFDVHFHNPSAIYEPAVKARQALEAARASVARSLGAKQPEIIFTAGATEANNLAIYGVMRKFPTASVTFSAIEHDSVRFPAADFAHQIALVDELGIVDDVPISDETVLVSIMYANNEVGTIQPIKKIAQKIADIRTERRTKGVKLPLYFHIDAAQAGNYLDMNVSRLGVDLMSINGGKLYGPKQSGVLFVRSGIILEPLIKGGGQERGLRSGTENIAGAVGLAKSLEIAQSMKDTEVKRLQELQQFFIDHVPKNITVNGSLKHRLPNNLHITIPGSDNERMLMELDMNGIYAAAGSACSASSEEPSHVLAAMGLNIDDIRGSVRFSMGRGTKMYDIDALISQLQTVRK